MFNPLSRFRTSLFDTVAKVHYYWVLDSNGFRTSSFDTLAKRVFYRLHGAFSFSTSLSNTKTKSKINSFKLKNK